MVKKCKHCGKEIRWDDYYTEWQHNDGDPQCTDSFGNYLPSGGEPEES